MDIAKIKRLLKLNKGKLIIFSLLFLISIISSFVFYDPNTSYPKPWWSDIVLTVKRIPGLWAISVIHWIIVWPVYALLYPLRYVLSDLYMKIGWIIELATSILYYVYCYIFSCFILWLKVKLKIKTKVVCFVFFILLVLVVIASEIFLYFGVN